MSITISNKIDKKMHKIKESFREFRNRTVVLWLDVTILLSYPNEYVLMQYSFWQNISSGNISNVSRRTTI